jgi:hypothetical protein
MTASSLAEKAKHAKPPASQGGWWSGRCPAHDDQHASLGWCDGSKKVGLSCKAGCTRAAIMAALGLTEKDMWLEPKQGKANMKKNIVATYDYVDEKGALLYQAVRYAVHGGGKTFSVRRPTSHQARRVDQQAPRGCTARALPPG